MDERKRYTAEEKVKILREVLEDGKGVSAGAFTRGRKLTGYIRTISLIGGSSYSRVRLEHFS
jgi:hypothetical protein